MLYCVSWIGQVYSCWLNVFVSFLFPAFVPFNIVSKSVTGGEIVALADYPSTWEVNSSRSPSDTWLDSSQPELHESPSQTTKEMMLGSMSEDQR